MSNALDISIKHWEDILIGDDSLYSGTQPCALCDKHRYIKEINWDSGILNEKTYCDTCPLSIIGQQCDDEESIWASYADHFFDIVTGDIPLENIELRHLSQENKKTLMGYAHRMLNTLKGLKDESNTIG